MPTVAEINTRIDAAVAFMDAGDYASAKSKLETVQVLMVALPDAEKGDESLKWDREAVDAALQRLGKLATAASLSASGIRRVKYERVVVTD